MFLPSSTSRSHLAQRAKAICPHPSVRLSLAPQILYLIAANGQQDVLLGDLKASAEHGLEVRLATALPKAGHFPGAGHFYAQHHISTRQTRERELGHLRQQDVREAKA